MKISTSCHRYQNLFQRAGLKNLPDIAVGFSRTFSLTVPRACRRERRRWCLLQSSDVSLNAMKDRPPKLIAIGLEVASRVFLKSRPLGKCVRVLSWKRDRSTLQPTLRFSTSTSTRAIWWTLCRSFETHGVEIRSLLRIAQSLMRSALQVPICGKRVSGGGT